MMIHPDDLTDGTTKTYQLLKQLTDEAKALRQKANQLIALDAKLAYFIQEGKITDTDEIETAIAKLRKELKLL